MQYLSLSLSTFGRLIYFFLIAEFEHVYVSQAQDKIYKT